MYSRIIMRRRRRSSGNMPTEGKDQDMRKNISDGPTKRRRRGRPVNIESSVVVGSADTYRLWFEALWSKLGSRLLAARSSKEITKAIRENAPDVSTSLAPHSELILQILRDPKFPAVRSASQIHFLADSLGGQGFVGPRRSREICAEERSRVRHVIVRRNTTLSARAATKGQHWTGPVESAAPGSCPRT